MTPEIQLDTVSYVYPQSEVRALGDLRLDIAAGESVAFVGQNGSGKTTLLRHLVGLARPTEGRVLIGGRDTRQTPVAELARLIGLVFQDPDHQVFSPTVHQEVAFGARNLGFRGTALEARVSAALARVGLGETASRNPYDLGYAHRKLVALASVLAMETPVLVFDEPTASQDHHGFERIRAIVAEQHKAGGTVIVATHDLEFVAENFDRVVVLASGHIVLDGPPDTVFSQASWPALTEAGLQPPLAARLGARLGLGPTPTIADLARALRGRQVGPSQQPMDGQSPPPDF